MMLGMVAAGDLSDAERRVWDAFPTGKLVVFGTGNAEDDDPAGGEGWGPDRQVRAEVLVTLLCGAVEVDPGQASGICLDRVCVIGKLGFPGATFKHRLRLNRCYVADGVDLTEATTQTLRLEGCHVGAINLYDAKINGALILSGAHLHGIDGRALGADNLTVTGNMVCNGFQAEGEVSLHSAGIGGQLNLRSAHLASGIDGHAMTADGLTVTGNIFCNGFQADGQIRLVGASIEGELSLNGASLDGMDGPALTADGLTVTGNIFCNGFQADGQISLVGASIEGELSLSGAHLNGKDRSALTADRLTVTENMYCDEGFQADGEIRLAAASIGSQLRLSGAHLNGIDAPALTADGLTVTGNMYCDKGSRPTGRSAWPPPASGGNSFSAART
jgi:hypothetical protein